MSANITSAHDTGGLLWESQTPFRINIILLDGNNFQCLKLSTFWFTALVVPRETNHATGCSVLETVLLNTRGQIADLQAQTHRRNWFAEHRYVTGNSIFILISL